MAAGCGQRARSVSLQSVVSVCWRWRSFAGCSDYGGGADATLTRVLYNDAVFTAGVIIDDYMRARISTFFEKR